MEVYTLYKTFVWFFQVSSELSKSCKEICLGDLTKQKQERKYL